MSLHLRLQRDLPGVTVLKADNPWPFILYLKDNAIPGFMHFTPISPVSRETHWRFSGLSEETDDGKPNYTNLCGYSKVLACARQMLEQVKSFTVDSTNGIFSETVLFVLENPFNIEESGLSARIITDPWCQIWF